MFVFLRIIEDDAPASAQSPTATPPAKHVGAQLACAHGRSAGSKDGAETLRGSGQASSAPTAKAAQGPLLVPSAKQRRGNAKAKPLPLKGRVCTRAGCGKRLLTKSGAPDCRRYFCSGKCRLADRGERLRRKRIGLRGRKCPLCGRESSGDTRFYRSVTRHTPSRIVAAAK